MLWEQKVQYATLSDIGLRRRNNQDSFAVQLCSEHDVWNGFGHLFVVADGMGGHAVGELASKIAVDTIPLTFYKSRAGSVSTALVEAIERANAMIYERGTQNHDFKRMGTTCVVLVLSSQGATLGHVGDSRAYRIRKDRIEQLTFDHSLHWEMQRAGRLKPGEVFLPEAKHVITRSLGPEGSVEVDIDGPFPVVPGDRFVLCSDGLTGHVEDPEIGMIVRELAPEEASRLLVNLANLRGGSDNSTVIVVDAGEVPDGAGSASTDDLDEQRSSVSPFWLLLFWLSVLVTAIGGVLVVMERPLQGAGFLGVGVLAMIGLIRKWMRSRKNPESTESEPSVKTQAYRTASARTKKEFIASLAKIERELREMAVEEAWKIEWPDHETAIHDAREAIAGNNNGRAMSELGKAIDTLMIGLHAHRKKIRNAQIVSQSQATRKQDESGKQDESES